MHQTRLEELRFYGLELLGLLVLDLVDQIALMRPHDLV